MGKPKRCFVSNCKNQFMSRKYDRESGISFHRFPDHIKRKALYDKWVKNCQFANGNNYNPVQSSVICSAHFDPKDVIRTKNGWTDRCYVSLEKDAIPKYFPPPMLAGSNVFVDVVLQPEVDDAKGIEYSPSLSVTGVDDVTGKDNSSILSSSDTREQVIKEETPCQIMSDCNGTNSREEVVSSFPVSEAILSVDNGRLHVNKGAATVGNTAFPLLLTFSGTVDQWRSECKPTVVCDESTNPDPGRGSLFECIKCGKRLLSFEDYKQHLLESHGEKEDKVRCLICDEVVDGKLINGHHALYHANQELQSESYSISFPCQVCDSVLATEDAWMVHSRRHFELSEFQCLKCDCHFDTVGDFSDHLKSHELGNAYNCVHCERGFSLSAAMHAHDCSRGEGSFKGSKNHLSANDLSISDFSPFINDQLENYSYEHDDSADDDVDDESSTMDNVPDEESTHIHEVSLTEHDHTYYNRPHELKLPRNTSSVRKSSDDRPPIKNNSSKSSSTGKKSATKESTKTKRVRSCRYCEYKTCKLNEYSIHMKTDHPGELVSDGFKAVEEVQSKDLHYQLSRLYPCPDCPKRFKTEKYLILHQRKEHNLPCEICGTQCYLERSTDYQRIENGPEHLCNECGNCFQSRLALCKHIRMEHPPLRYLCSACGEFFSTNHTLQYHSKCSNKPAKLRKQCPECGGFFRELKLHILTKHTATEKQFTCEFCGKCFSYFANLNRHKRVSHEGYRYQCPLCDYTATVKLGIDVHYEQIHVDDDKKTLLCEVCNEIFSSERMLKLHRGKHISQVKKGIIERKCTDGKGKKLCFRRPARYKQTKCTLCPLSFSNKFHLQNHMIVHGIGNYVSCQYCQKKFISVSRMKTHERLFHTGEKPFKCDICSERFIDKVLLIYHKKIHSRKGLVCYTCKERFHDVFKWREHVKIHRSSKNKRYQCKFCERRYFDRHALKLHEMAHVGVKPYTCELCGLGFTELRNLKQHSVIHKTLTFSVVQ